MKVVAGLDNAGFILFAVGEGAEGLDIVPSWHAHAHVLRLSAFAGFQGKDVPTRVMGMFGAFGNMNETSSNLLRRRQFSARKILYTISMPRCRRLRALPSCAGVTQAVGNDDGGGVLLESGNDKRCSSSHVSEHVALI